MVGFSLSAHVLVERVFVHRGGGRNQRESLNREHLALLVEFDAAVRHRDHLLENFCAARRAAGLAQRGLADEEREKRGARNVLNEGTKNTGLERAAQPQELPAALATFQKNIAPKIRFLVGATDDELVAALTRFCAIPAIRASFLRQNPHYSNLTDGWGCRRG
jgi:hypothetical protein